MGRNHATGIAWGLGLAVVLWATPAAAAEGGLEVFPKPLQLALLILFFAALIPVLDRVLFRPLLSVLDEREAKIDGARRRASELAAEARELLARYEATLAEVRARLEADRRSRVEEARRAHMEKVTEARRAAEEQLQRTRAEVEQALEAARGELRREAEALARELASRLLGRSVA